MTPREFLQVLMDHHQDNPNSLSKKCRVPQSTIFRFLTGTAREPRSSTISAIAKHYGIPVEAFYNLSIRQQIVERLSGNDVISGTGFKSTALGYWPFSAPIKKYEQLDPIKKQRLDEKISDFLDGASSTETD